MALGWLEDAVGLLGLQPVWWWHAHAVDHDEKMQALVCAISWLYVYPKDSKAGRSA